MEVEPRRQDKGLTIDEDGVWWFRQSHLDTWLLCPERARLSLRYPEYGTEGDAAMCGTAAHAAIEAFLYGEIERNHIPQYAYEWALAACEVHEINWQKFSGALELAQHAANCARGWVEGILPNPRLQLGGIPEWKFAVELGSHDGYRYGIKGTADYVTDQLWDWKNPGDEYKQWEKQRWAIQPTAYAVAAHQLLGWEYPIQFTYGLSIRRKGPAKTQLLTVTRTAGHEAWLHNVIQRYMDCYLHLGLETAWPLDNGHSLCSQKWCDHWSLCQGKFITDEQHRLPDPYVAR